MVAALIAAVLVTVGQLAHWRGVDMAASVYRVNSYRSGGFSLWDFQWYGGHFTLSYTVVYPPLAAFLGIAVLAVLSAATASLAFDRLIRAHFARTPAMVAAGLFAAGTVVQSSIGQLPFLTGEAFGLLACWAASRGRWWVAALFALLASATSPLAGMFVGMAVTAWVLCRWSDPNRASRIRRGLAVVLAAGTPILAVGLIFPGTGTMPYPFWDFVFEIGVAAGFWVAATLVGQPMVRWVAVVFVATAVFAEAVPSSLGGNVGRLEDLLALPVGVALLWNVRRFLIPLLTWPLLLSQWVPAWGAITSDPAAPSTQEAFFAPLDNALERLSRNAPLGRVEVVPTADHWEAAYVAPVMPLARGWERQLDTADNPIFYRPGQLDGSAYRSWLIDNGVRFVALANAPLDPAGVAEATLVRSGQVRALRLVWANKDWRLYRVSGSAGIVSGPAVLLSTDTSRITVDAEGPGQVLIRVRYSPYWKIESGEGCVARFTVGDQIQAPWVMVKVPGPEQFTLGLSLFSRSACSTAAVLADHQLDLHPAAN